MRKSLFTRKVIAEYLGVSKDQVIALMKEGAPIAKNEFIGDVLNLIT